MPNETSNYIQIYGEQEKIDNFINIHKKLIPIEYNENSSDEEEEKTYDNNLNAFLIFSVARQECIIKHTNNFYQ